MYALDVADEWVIFAAQTGVGRVAEIDGDHAALAVDDDLRGDRRGRRLLGLEAFGADGEIRLDHKRQRNRQSQQESKALRGHFGTSAGKCLKFRAFLLLLRIGRGGRFVEVPSLLEKMASALVASRTPAGEMCDPGSLCGVGPNKVASLNRGTAAWD